MIKFDRYAYEHSDERRMARCARSRRRSETARALVARHKDVPCFDCGVKYPSYVMQFDHINQDKSFGIGSQCSRMTLRQIVTEIAKCQVVCANCHMERTHG